MHVGQKIRLICENEGITLRNFSAETGIAYSTLRSYTREKAPYSPTDKQLRKITSHARFAQYTGFLMSLDESIGETNIGNTDGIKSEYAVFEPSDTYNVSDRILTKDEFADLYEQVCSAGKEGEALRYLKFLTTEKSDK